MRAAARRGRVAGRLRLLQLWRCLQRTKPRRRHLQVLLARRRRQRVPPRRARRRRAVRAVSWGTGANHAQVHRCTRPAAAAAATAAAAARAPNCRTATAPAAAASSGGGSARCSRCGACVAARRGDCRSLRLGRFATGGDGGGSGIDALNVLLPGAPPWAHAALPAKGARAIHCPELRGRAARRRRQSPCQLCACVRSRGGRMKERRSKSHWETRGRLST